MIRFSTQDKFRKRHLLFQVSSPERSIPSLMKILDLHASPATTAPTGHDLLVDLQLFDSLFGGGRLAGVPGHRHLRAGALVHGVVAHLFCRASSPGQIRAELPRLRGTDAYVACKCEEVYFNFLRLTLCLCGLCSRSCL